VAVLEGILLSYYVQTQELISGHMFAINEDAEVAAWHMTSTGSMDQLDHTWLFSWITAIHWSI